MNEYFKMIAEHASLDPKEYSIKDLTLELATKAGYHREMYVYKGGSSAERTVYDRPFDSILTAKWLMHYKKLFNNKLGTHPEFGDRRIDIVNRTFLMVMNCLKIEMVVDDDIVNKYTNLALAGRIQNELIEMGSQKRFEEYKSGKKLNMRLGKYILNSALSLDEMAEVTEIDSILGFDEIHEHGDLFELYDELRGNPYGWRLLDALVNSNRKVKMNEIDKYMYLSEDEKTDETKRLLMDALYKVKEYLKKDIADKFKYDFGFGDEDIIGFSEVNE